MSFPKDVFFIGRCKVGFFIESDFFYGQKFRLRRAQSWLSLFFQYGQASEAKYLGKINSDSDDEANSSKAYETAENSVIDKRIK